MSSQHLFLMEITILGTSSMVPTKERNALSVFLRYKNLGVLFDCAEGTQRQMNIAGISRAKINKILISHWHGDHIAGMIGLLQTLGNKEQNPYIEIYGPVGTKEYMKHLLKSCYFDVQVDIKIIELNPRGLKTFFENEDIQIQSIKLEHSTPCLGYAFVEKDRKNIDVKYLKKNKIKEGPHLEKLKQGKDITFEGKKIKAKDATYIVPGKKFTYLMDTMYCKNAIILSQDSDILLSEATFDASLKNKAEQYKHMTTEDAAHIASEANVKELIITHFSQRYKEVSQLVAEARAIFPNVRDAFDLMKIKL